MTNQDNNQENRTQPIKRGKHNRVFTPNGHWSKKDRYEFKHEEDFRPVRDKDDRVVQVYFDREEGREVAGEVRYF